MQKQLDNMFNYTVKCDAHDKAHPTRVAKFRR